jgi:hypothetical protein
VKKLLLTAFVLSALCPLVQAGHHGGKPAHRPAPSHGHYRAPAAHHGSTYGKAPKYSKAPTYHGKKPTYPVKPVTYARTTTYRQHGGSPAYRNVVKTYAATYGVKFSKGVYYKGHHHKHWAKSYWSPKWKTRFFYCPSAVAWYYWYAPKACYYPVGYMNEAPPVVGKAEAEQEEQGAVQEEKGAGQEEIPDPELPEPPATVEE